jgi:hypothetical protein
MSRSAATVVDDVVDSSAAGVEGTCEPWQKSLLEHFASCWLSKVSPDDAEISGSSRRAGGTRSGAKVGYIMSCLNGV